MNLLSGNLTVVLHFKVLPYTYTCYIFLRKLIIKFAFIIPTDLEPIFIYRLSVLVCLLPTRGITLSDSITFQNTINHFLDFLSQRHQSIRTLLCKIKVHTKMSQKIFFFKEQQSVENERVLTNFLFISTQIDFKLYRPGDKNLLKRTFNMNRYT